MNPAAANHHNNLGNSLMDCGKIEDAITEYRQAIQLYPQHAEAHHNVASALHDLGRRDEAIAAYRLAIQFAPNFAAAYSNLGTAQNELGQTEQAIESYRAALRINPNLPETHNNLANALRALGKTDEAIHAYQQAIRLKPDFVQALGNFASLLQQQRLLHQSIAIYRRVIELKPDFAEAHSNLGDSLQQLGELDQAQAALQTAVNLKPQLAAAWNNLGNVAKDRGMIEQAVDYYRKSISVDPTNAAFHSNLLFALLFNPAQDSLKLRDENRLWNNRHAAPLKKLIEPHDNHRDPDRRLKIGYVSPDFREHCQALFTIPLLSHHDHQNFEIFCYSDVSMPDSTTQRLQKFTNHWRNVYAQPDEPVAEQIRKDGIDILVDLTMHMSHNRLLLFARKPAPVQISWLAYPGSTGLEAIDFRLSDPRLDPLGMDDSIYSETSIRLPETFWCYDPLADDLAVNELPAAKNGFITLGCLNNFCKVNPAVLDLWSRVLHHLPDSRMLILCPAGSHRRQVLERLAVDASRIEFITMQPRANYLQHYHRIDFALDTFPYNGHTTSLDAMWMGVPTVTLLGSTVVGRAGFSQLCNIRLSELAAESKDQYIEIARELAGDISKMKHLRASLRDRMCSSPLMDYTRFARNVESAYRQAWRKWCAQ